MNKKILILLFLPLVIGCKVTPSSTIINSSSEINKNTETNSINSNSASQSIETSSSSIKILSSINSTNSIETSNSSIENALPEDGYGPLH